VNATMLLTAVFVTIDGFNGHPPLGVNATTLTSSLSWKIPAVSMGTHP